MVKDTPFWQLQKLLLGEMHIKDKTYVGHMLSETPKFPCAHFKIWSDTTNGGFNTIGEAFHLMGGVENSCGQRFEPNGLTLRGKTKTDTLSG